MILSFALFESAPIVPGGVLFHCAEEDAGNVIVFLTPADHFGRYGTLKPEDSSYQTFGPRAWPGVPAFKTQDQNPREAETRMESEGYLSSQDFSDYCEREYGERLES